MGLHRRIVVSEVRCAVRINIDRDDHLAWIAKRWLKADGDNWKPLLEEALNRFAGGAAKAAPKLLYP
jgi:hypothetical protein